MKLRTTPLLPLLSLAPLRDLVAVMAPMRDPVFVTFAALWMFFLRPHPVLPGFAHILLAGSPTSDAPPAALGLRAAFIRRTTSSPSVSRHLRRVEYPEGTPPCLSTGNFYFLTLADIFSPEYFLPLCYRTPPYYWERTLSVCIMHLYSVFCLCPPPTLILSAYFYFSLYAHPYVLSL